MRTLLALALFFGFSVHANDVLKRRCDQRFEQIKKIHSECKVEGRVVNCLATGNQSGRWMKVTYVPKANQKPFEGKSLCVFHHEQLGNNNKLVNESEIWTSDGKTFKEIKDPDSGKVSRTEVKAVRSATADDSTAVPE